MTKRSSPPSKSGKARAGGARQRRPRFPIDRSIYKTILADDLLSRLTRELNEKAKLGGAIEDIAKNAVPLPDVPANLWQGKPRGISKAEGDALLLDFLRSNYGKYFADHRETLRGYIFRSDRKLYQAIVDFEKTADLPEEFAMPTERDLVRIRLKRASEGEYDDMSLSERRSVRRILSQLSKPKGP